MQLLITRPGHYAVAAGDQLVGRVRGDYVLGFEAERADGCPLVGVFPEPTAAAEALLAHVASTPNTAYDRPAAAEPAAEQAPTAGDIADGDATHTSGRRRRRWALSGRRAA